MDYEIVQNKRGQIMAWNGAPWPVWGCAPKSTNYVRYGCHEGEIIGEKNGYLIIHCRVCILNHVANLPTEEFLAEYYAKQFYTFSKPDYVERYERDRDWWEMHHNYTIQQVRSLLWDRTVLSVIDVGSGPGIFLDCAKNAGFETYGVEPCDEIAELSRKRGHHVWTGVLKDQPGKYDMVNAYEVLEHVPDPEGFLDICRGMLNPGGVLCVTVPNDYNLLQLEAQKRLGLKEWWLAPPEHLNYFEPKSLQLMVRRVGFKVRDIRTTFPLERFLLDGMNYIGNDEVGREIHAARKHYEYIEMRLGRWEQLMETYRDQCSDPYSGTIGREIVLIATKE